MSEVKQKPQIQAKDLRIGNRINRHFENGEPEEIECSIRDIFDCQRSATERDFKFSFSGIPLTEEWLLRMGAVVASDPHDRWGGWLIGDIRFMKDDNGLYHLTGSPYGLEIRLPYVHKLQNFMYEYSGIELTITGI